MFRLVLICPTQRMFGTVPLVWICNPDPLSIRILLFNSTLLVETLCGQASGNANNLIINNLLIILPFGYKSYLFTRRCKTIYTKKYNDSTRSHCSSA